MRPDPAGAGGPVGEQPESVVVGGRPGAAAGRAADAAFFAAFLGTFAGHQQ